MILFSYKYSQELLVLMVCVTSFLCGIPHIYQGGIYTFHIVDYYSATISLMYIAFFETIALSIRIVLKDLVVDYT